MMSELVPGQVKSFSIGFDDPSFDESKYAEMVANHLGTEHRMMRLSHARCWTLCRSYQTSWTSLWPTRPLCQPMCCANSPASM